MNIATEPYGARCEPAVQNHILWGRADRRNGNSVPARDYQWRTCDMRGPSDGQSGVFFCLGWRVC